MDTTQLKKRFQSHIEVDPQSGCWIWTSTLCKGYATMQIGERKNARVIRWIYDLLIEPITEGKELHHACLVRECVNPFHLQALSHKEHIRVHAKLGAWNGIRNGNAKRTEQEILTIKLLNQYFMLSAPLIAKAMRIPVRSIYSILSGEVWKHIQLPPNLKEIWNDETVKDR